MSKCEIRFVRQRRPFSHRSDYLVIAYYDDDPDGEELVGELRHMFTKPKEMVGTFCHPIHGMARGVGNVTRRGWATSTDLDQKLGIIHDYTSYMSYPLYELKALVKHCLSNNVSLRGLSSKDIRALAKHCRQIELAKRKNK